MGSTAALHNGVLTSPHNQQIRSALKTQLSTTESQESSIKLTTAMLDPSLLGTAQVTAVPTKSTGYIHV